MKINWKVRLKNKTWLITFTGVVIAFVYQVLGMLGVAPAISEDSATQIVGIVINLLVAVGVVADPTTQGITDSDQAMTYDEPK
jgi:phi LC3 family holin